MRDALQGGEARRSDYGLERSGGAARWHLTIGEGHSEPCREGAGRHRNEEDRRHHAARTSPVHSDSQPAKRLVRPLASQIRGGCAAHGV
jgi:hypothetical protein